MHVDKEFSTTQYINMTFQTLASLIAKDEGLKVQTSIGNIREILRIAFDVLGDMPATELAALLSKYRKR